MNNKWILFFYFLLLSIFNVKAQTIHITGLIKDSLTSSNLPAVTIYDNLEHKALMSDSNGKFLITTKGKIDLKFDYVGYKVKHFKAFIIRDTSIVFYIKPSDDQLNEVTIIARKKRYSNKHNPAVELIRKIILHKPENTIDYYATAHYEKYSKVNFYVEKFPKWLKKSNLLKKYDFVLNQNDTATIAGKKLLPIYMEEAVSDIYFRKKPKAEGRELKAEKNVDYGKFIDIHGVSALLNRLFEDVNIYDDNIMIFTKQFTSPISDIGPTLYKYFIVDTVNSINKKLIKLRFEPRNDADLLFKGIMYVSLDGRYAVDSIELNTDKNINLGVLRNFSIQQNYNIDTATSHYYLSYSSVVADFGLYKSVAGLVGRKTIGINNFISNKPIADSLLSKRDDILLRKESLQTEDYWQEHRTIPLQNGEQNIYTKMDSLRNMKSFQNTLDWFNTLSSGYKTFNKFQVGPINSFIDYNPVEGFKPRIGGRTLPEFNKNIYFSGYAAYGTRDDKVKYMAKATYAFNHKSIYSFPVHSISVASSFDTNIPGMPDNNEQGNVIFATNNGNFNRYLYNHIFRIDYLNEFKNHLSVEAGIKIKDQRPGGELQFIKQTYINNDSLLSSINTSEVSAGIRWAPHEQFYQNGSNRFIIPSKYPVFRFDYTRGISGIFGSNYNYNNFHLNIRKRVYLSILGISHVSVDAGYIVGKVPWPLLTIHEGNQGLGNSTTGFNTMNYMEFMSDHYASLSIEHNFNGLFFNRIPLVRKLKWREIVGAKILYGGTRKENNPLYNKDLLQLPYTPTEQTYFLSGKPYAEINFGIANMFKILEINIIRRLTYLDHPDINKWNIKFGFNLEL